MNHQDSITFLTKEELKLLTGRCVKRLQIEWLRKQGMQFFVNASGQPVVPRSAIEGNSTAKIKHAPKAWQPSVTA